MTILEQRFMEAVPMYLKEIARELKRLNDLKEQKLELLKKKQDE